MCSREGFSVCGRVSRLSLFSNLACICAKFWASSPQNGPVTVSNLAINNQKVCIFRFIKHYSHTDLFTPGHKGRQGSLQRTYGIPFNFVVPESAYT